MEVDRGRCVGFAWAGADDVYAVLSPAYRCAPPPPDDTPPPPSSSSSSLRGLAGATAGPAALPTRSAARLFAGAGTGGADGEASHGPLIPSKLFFKRVPAATSGAHGDVACAADVAVDLTAARETQSGPGSACPLFAQEVFGGPLLCLSTPTRAEAARRAGLPATADVPGGQRAFSQIEADALRRQQEAELQARTKDERAADAKVASQAASVAAVVAASATAWEEAVGGGSEHLRTAQKSRFYVLSADPDAGGEAAAAAVAGGRGRGRWALRAVGPPMLAPRQVSWDASTGLAAVLVGNTVNILRLETTRGDSDGNNRPRTPERAPDITAGMRASALAVTLSVVGAVDLAAHASGAALAAAHFPCLVGLHWHAGQLFACTATDVLLLSTSHPYLPPTASATGGAATASATLSGAGDVARVSAAERRKIQQQRRKGGGGGDAAGLGQADDDPSLLALLQPWGGPQAPTPPAPPLSPSAVDVVVLASTGAPAAAAYGRGHLLCDVPAPRPAAAAGWLDVVGVSRGVLALATRDGAVAVVSLAAPRAACLRLLGAGRAGDALAWAAGSEACAGYFTRRGLLPGALALAAGAEAADGRAGGKREADGSGGGGGGGTAAEVAAAVAVSTWPADVVAAARAWQQAALL